MSDGDRVLQIISNLLSNAFRWTPDGGKVELELTASNGCRRDEVRFQLLELPHLRDIAEGIDGAVEELDARGRNPALAVDAFDRHDHLRVTRVGR